MSKRRKVLRPASRHISAETVAMPVQIAIFGFGQLISNSVERSCKEHIVGQVGIYSDEVSSHRKSFFVKNELYDEAGVRALYRQIRSAPSKSSKATDRTHQDHHIVPHPLQQYISSIPKASLSRTHCSVVFFPLRSVPAPTPTSLIRRSSGFETLPFLIGHSLSRSSAPSFEVTNVMRQPRSCRASARLSNGIMLHPSRGLRHAAAIVYARKSTHCPIAGYENMMMCSPMVTSTAVLNPRGEVSRTSLDCFDADCRLRSTHFVHEYSGRRYRHER